MSRRYNGIEDKEENLGEFGRSKMGLDSPRLAFAIANLVICSVCWLRLLIDRVPGGVAESSKNSL